MLKLLAGLALATATLAACATATLQTNLQAINADISTFNSNLNADLGVLAQNSATACNIAAVLHAGFQDAAALSGKVAAQSATEAAAYQIVATTCANPPTTGSAAAATLVSQVQAVQAIVKGATGGTSVGAATPASNQP